MEPPPSELVTVLRLRPVRNVVTAGNRAADGTPAPVCSYSVHTADHSGTCFAPLQHAPHRRNSHVSGPTYCDDLEVGVWYLTVDPVQYATLSWLRSDLWDLSRFALLGQLR